MTITRHWNIPGNPVQVRIHESNRNDYTIGKTKNVNEVVHDVIRVLPTKIIVVRHAFEMSMCVFNDDISYEFVGESDRNIEFTDKQKGYIGIEMIKFLLDDRVDMSELDMICDAVKQKLELEFPNE